MLTVTGCLPLPIAVDGLDHGGYILPTGWGQGLDAVEETVEAGPTRTGGRAQTEKSALPKQEGDPQKAEG